MSSNPAQGWTWVQDDPHYHYFVGEDSMCGVWYIEDVDPEELEPNLLHSRSHCRACQVELIREAAPTMPAGEPVGKWLSGPAVTKFLRDHFALADNTTLAEVLGVKLQTLRVALHSIGLYRMRLNYWPDAAVADLKALYATHGDTELAQLFETRYPKDKDWHIKHIEKKRGYLGLHRTTAMLLYIEAKRKGQQPHQDKTEYRKNGYVGEVRIFRPANGREACHMKCEDGPWRPLGPIMWEQENGAIPEGMRIVFVDGDPTNCMPENLLLARHEDVPRITITGEKRLASDKWIACTLTYRATPEERAYLLQFPELLTVRRDFLRLKRNLKLLKTQVHQYEDAPAHEGTK